MESLADVICSSGGSDNELVPCVGGDEDELGVALLLDPQKRGIEKTRFGKVSKCGAHPELGFKAKSDAATGVTWPTHCTVTQIAIGR
jgi:hypothetical protein